MGALIRRDGLVNKASCGLIAMLAVSRKNVEVIVLHTIMFRRNSDERFLRLADYLIHKTNRV